MRRGRRTAFLVLAVLAVSVGAYWIVDRWRFRTEWESVRRELVRGRYLEAWARLTRLATRWPQDSMVRYHLGVCTRSSAMRQRR